MKVLVTGGAGFVGSHVAEFYAKNNNEVIIIDNLSRGQTLEKADRSEEAILYNWNYLKKYNNVILKKGDLRNKELIKKVVSDVDFIIHTAGQVAVTSSITDPLNDFETNALGTFNILEAARKSINQPAIAYCSTNKVYGKNVNKISTKKKETRYEFDDKNYFDGIPEEFSIDQCSHSPYGCSKLCGDIYVQDYADTYNLETCVFRMSCIYGTRQFGNEDQGWIAHFIISILQDKPLIIYGDGKQVRDILFINDLVNAFNLFYEKRQKLSGEVFNIGGGPTNTLSLIELLDLIKKLTGQTSSVNFTNWRVADQKVYVSDISKAKEKLGWEPRIDVLEGIKNFITWFKSYSNISK
jgi:CDP-paratose 2-epimerase